MLMRKGLAKKLVKPKAPGDKFDNKQYFIDYYFQSTGSLTSFHTIHWVVLILILFI